MKKSKILRLFIVAALFICFAFCGVNLMPARASLASPDINNNNYSSTYQMDESLYYVIKAVAKQLNFNQPLPGFDSDIFTTGYNDYQPKAEWFTEGGEPKTDTIEKNIEDSQLIKNDLAAGVLDLTIGEKAKYKCLQDKNLDPIKNISGLNDLALDTIKTLILDNHQISTIKQTDFENLTNLQNLSVRNNSLESVELNSSLLKLNAVDFSGNNLTQVDVSKLVYYGGKYPTCNLSNNNIESIDGLKFSTSTKLESLNLSFNKLHQLTTQQIEVLSNNVNGTKPVFLGVQAESDFDSLIAGSKIVVYNLPNSDIAELNVVASYFEGDATLTKSDFYVDGQDNIICETVGVEQIETLFVPAGKIRLSFYSGDTEITVENFPALEKLAGMFSSKVCKVALPSPTYTLTANGKVVTDTYQETDVVVDFVVSTANIPNALDVKNTENGAKIYSGFSRDYSKDVQSSLTVNSNGTFDCAAIAVFDGIESVRASVNITRKNMAGIIWGLVIIVLLFVVGGAIYYTTRWIKDGAPVAPLSQKEIFNANRRKERKYGRERQTKYSQLDASLRNKKRQGINSDDLTDENLNESADTSLYNNNEYRDYNSQDFDDDYKNLNRVDYNSYGGFEEDGGQFDEENNTDETDDVDFDGINDDGPEDIY